MTTAIQCELGATENWFRNSQKAKRDGLEYCEHCGKGMAQGTGFLIRCIIETETVVAFDSTEGTVVRIGTTCINKFAFNKLPATHYAKAGA
jgi:hypothetical protein